MNHVQEQQLEQLLQKAANEPAYRPEFMERLLDSQVYCLGATAQNDQSTQGLIQLNEGDQIYLKKWQNAEGKLILPFFLSVESLSKVVDHEESYLCLNARELFAMTLGEYLMLNPNLPYGKEFTPEEIQSLLQPGGYLQTETYTAEEDTQVLLGQPSQYPDYMVAQLNKLFEQRPEIEKAYLALMHNPKRDEKPVLVIGLIIQPSDNTQSLVNQVGQVAYESQGETVDISVIDPQETTGLSGYLLETTPFYIRADKPRGFWSRLFS